ncbi:mutator-like transposase [Striga asiatica]|uniref:Mutator-like transposase n=1 Tax=Striga asiatica TaxID=4170 RepID=A0A5A7QQ48_STRAF|nr:mutator-like transposase [Striga asiatica]
MTCQRCFQKGHNKKSCTNPQVEKPPKNPRGRPKKNPGQQSTQEEVVEAGSQNVAAATQAQRRNKLPARKGYGILQSEETGNTYMKLSSERRVHLIPRKDASGSRSKASGSGASGSGSQENDIFRGMGTSNSSRFAIGKEKLGNWERSSKLGRYEV